MVSEGASVDIDAEVNSPKKSTRTVISSVNVQVSIVTSTLILSPLSNSPTPLPAVAVKALERLAAPRETSFLKNSYAAVPAVSAARIVIVSPAQNKLSSTPEVRFGS